MQITVFNPDIKLSQVTRVGPLAPDSRPSDSGLRSLFRRHFLYDLISNFDKNLRKMIRLLCSCVQSEAP